MFIVDLVLVILFDVPSRMKEKPIFDTLTRTI